jgi:hypothetical protein
LHKDLEKDFYKGICQMDDYQFWNGSTVSSDLLTGGTPAIIDQTDGVWNVNTDTAVDADNGSVNLFNTPGDLSYAATQGGGTNTPTPSTPSFFDQLSHEVNKTIGTMLDSTIKAGTASAAQQLGNIVGKANPPPSNTNTNLANKSLLSRVSSAQQQMSLGGLTEVIKDQKNWPLLIGSVAAVFILFRIFA